MRPAPCQESSAGRSRARRSLAPCSAGSLPRWADPDHLGLDPGGDGRHIGGAGGVDAQSWAELEWPGRVPPPLPFIVSEQVTMDRMTWVAPPGSQRQHGPAHLGQRLHVAVPGLLVLPERGARGVPQHGRRELACVHDALAAQAPAGGSVMNPPPHPWHTHDLPVIFSTNRPRGKACSSAVRSAYH